MGPMTTWRKKGRMKTKTINVYQYNELSEKAKEKVKDWYISNEDFYSQWESMQEDAKTIGIKLNSIHREAMQGEFIECASDVIKLIKENHGESCQTYKTAIEYEAKYNALKEDEYGNLIDDEDLPEEFLQSILEDYRIMWEKEVEYCYSDEYINETMEANEYEFDINGNRI